MCIRDRDIGEMSSCRLIFGEADFLPGLTVDKFSDILVVQDVYKRQRLGNNWSYKYARRQWSLVDNGLLKYQWLADFDKAMLKTAKAGQVFDSSPENLWMDKENKIIAYRKGKLIFLFNFHPEHSNPEFFVPTHAAGKYKVVLSTDDPEYGLSLIHI